MSISARALQGGASFQCRNFFVRIRAKFEKLVSDQFIVAFAGCNREGCESQLILNFDSCRAFQQFADDSALIFLASPMKCGPSIFTLRIDGDA